MDRKLFHVSSLLLLFLVLFPACNKETDREKDAEEKLSNGLYIGGAATGYANPIAACAMTKGTNAATGSRREGMYEKYVVLQAGKDFYLQDVTNGSVVRYSAALEDASSGGAAFLRGALVTGADYAMKVERTGLYHVIMDLNRDGALDDAGGSQIVLIPVETFSILGDWGEDVFLPMSCGTLSNDGTTFSLECDLSSGGNFLFAYAREDTALDKDGKVKVYSRLGEKLEHPVPGGKALPVQIGNNALRLSFKMSSGEVQKSFSATLDYSFDVDTRAEAMKASVLNSPNTVDPASVGGRCYYVSNEGKDYYDGLSPSRPIKSLARVNSLNLNPGDAVLFRRGDVWRREKMDRSAMVYTKPGVTYSAYGSGQKPIFNGSPCNAAKEGTWRLTDVPNVYEYSLNIDFYTDVGAIVYDGKDSAVKRISSVSAPFYYTDLKKDLDFFHQGEKLFLCSTEGNPAERFSDLEINVFGHAFEAVDNVTIDNVCIRFVGSHGIGSQTTESLVVTNCEVSWIGGSYSNTWADDPVRYGNAIEVYGGCKRYLVSNCWIYQSYDTGVTHQFARWESAPCIMENVTFSRNLIDYCTWSIEYYLHTEPSVDRMMRNILYEGNICRMSGYGWGSQRIAYDSPAKHIKSWKTDNPSENFVIRNNILYKGKDGMLQIYAAREDWYPEMVNNIIIE